MRKMHGLFREFLALATTLCAMLLSKGCTMRMLVFLALERRVTPPRHLGQNDVWSMHANRWLLPARRLFIRSRIVCVDTSVPDKAGTA